MFVYELSGSGFESSCSHLNFRFRACFEQGVSWHSDNYKVWIHSKKRTWHDKNIASSNNCTMQLHNFLLRMFWNSCYMLISIKTTVDQGWMNCKIQVHNFLYAMPCWTRLLVLGCTTMKKHKSCGYLKWPLAIILFAKYAKLFSIREIKNFDSIFLEYCNKIVF